MSLMPSLLPLTQDHEYGSALQGILVALRSMISLSLLALGHLLECDRSGIRAVLTVGCKPRVD
jgi:hypothetical protein